METGEPISIDKMDMNIITKLLRSCDCSIEGRTNEEISILLLQLAFTARSASLKFNYELIDFNNIYYLGELMHKSLEPILN